jgi:hypothetical protein
MGWRDLEEEMKKKSTGERIFSEPSMMRNRDKERTIEIPDAHIHHCISVSVLRS